MLWWLLVAWHSPPIITVYPSTIFNAGEIVTLITAVLPVARERLITINDVAPVVDAAKLLSTANTSLIIVCDTGGLMSGVVTKADIVRQISTCTGCSCVTMVADIMTR